MQYIPVGTENASDTEPKTLVKKTANYTHFNVQKYEAPFLHDLALILTMTNEHRH